MKTKTFQKKLNLAKSTVADLNDNDMTRARAGAGTDPVSEGPDCTDDCSGVRCPTVQPYSTCYPQCCSNDPGCEWPKSTDIPVYC